jgi:hypothetical protein
MDDSQDQFGLAYERLLALCAPLTFPPPWDFLPPAACCRGPVPDPEQALAALRTGFPDALLSAAGLLEAGPDGVGRLNPALAGPAAAVVAFRRRPGARPFALLTAAGCLPEGLLPVKAALEDGPTGAAARGGPLLVAAGVLEAALLRAVGLPVTLASGLGTLGADGLREVDAQFGRGTTLVLLGWSPLVPSAAPPPAIAAAAAHLARAREYLDLRLQEVAAWKFSPQEIDNLRYRLGLRDAAFAGGLLRASAREAKEELMDINCLCPGAVPCAGPPPPPSYPQAQAGLLAALAERRERGRTTDGLRAALAAYEAAVQRELVAPLQAWALADGDPLTRAAGAELASAAGVLHRMAPLVADLQAAHLLWPRGAELEPAQLLDQYLALTGRFGGLVRDLARWRNA